MQCVYIAVFCILALSIPAGTGLRCWSCSSSVDRHCGDPFNSTFFHMSDCDNHQSPHPYSQRSAPVCKKSKQTANGHEMIIRSCEYNRENPCLPSSGHSSIREVFCETCTVDGCNSAHRLTSVTLTALLPSALWTLAAKFL
ncbi:uncharacterized protein LOC111864958 [Cryptotermes secundus]|uniref:uncharacterized protein LOC111864958 n=1 Tax=Cryptotermes secundus TaxID=105785 RepID=UPI000CD7DC6F|nr:uncharacterized protein LOC111864958 [Cryptotermes secundus]